MSSETAIRVSKLSKCYQIYNKPLDRLKQMLWRGRKQFYREFWALKDVSLEIKKGETIGIVGRNGSGKSTLLQLICGILTPTSGEIEIRGRVAALLELGAGFNPEFTGRENVYLNAAILGLTREEAERKFPDIVAFANVGEFIDQPLKTYSSGMYVRLAFAVAIHVDPDVLVVDEALSVGDIGFRNKCMSRIRALRAQGVCILFVSHDLSTLQMICDRVIRLDNGQVVSIGDPISICQGYYVSATSCNVKLLSRQGVGDAIIAQQETGMARFVEFGLNVLPANGRPIYRPGQDVGFKFSLSADQPLDEVVFAVSIYREDGDFMIGQTSREAGVLWPCVARGGVHHGLFVLNENCLAPGNYQAAFGAYSKDLSLCYALTELTTFFSVRTDFPSWGKIVHPCQWVRVGTVDDEV